MDEEVLVRAIAIGVSLLMLIAVVSSIMMYYSQAQRLAGLTEFKTEKYYSDEIEATLSKINSSGTVVANGIELKNMVNYYYGSENVVINIKNMACHGGATTSRNIVNISNINNSPRATGFDSKMYKELVFNIMRNKNYRITKSTTISGVTTYTAEMI